MVLYLKVQSRTTPLGNAVLQTYTCFDVVIILADQGKIVPLQQFSLQHSWNNSKFMFCFVVCPVDFNHYYLASVCNLLVHRILTSSVSWCKKSDHQLMMAQSDFEGRNTFLLRRTSLWATINQCNSQSMPYSVNAIFNQCHVQSMPYSINAVFNQCRIQASS